MSETVVGIGSGWAQTGGWVWLVDGFTADDAAVLARWGQLGGGLERAERRVPIVELLNGASWRQASDAELDAERDRISGLVSPQGVPIADVRGAMVAADSAVKAQSEALARQEARAVQEPPVRPLSPPASGWSVYEPERKPVLGVREVLREPPMEERAGLVPVRRVEFPHDYPGAPGHDPQDPGECYTSDCAYQCGCWGPSRSGGPDGVDPFGECPANKARSDPRAVALRALASRMEQRAGAMLEAARVLRELVSKGEDDGVDAATPGR